MNVRVQHPRHGSMFTLKGKDDSEKEAALAAALAIITSDRTQVGHARYDAARKEWIEAISPLVKGAAKWRRSEWVNGGMGEGLAWNGNFD